jgi:hypothetical protein
MHQFFKSPRHAHNLSNNDPQDKKNDKSETTTSNEALRLQDGFAGGIS